jgi:monoamine oxidase
MKDGYGTLVSRALQAFPVSLSTPVRALRWGGAGVAVETPKGDIRAAAAIVTVSIGVLQAEAIRFDPPLPSATLTAIDGLHMGAMTKVGLAFDGDRLGVSTGADIFEIGAEPGDLLSTEAWGFDRNLMVATMGGRYARSVISLGEAGAVDHVLSRIVGMLGSEARRHFKAGRLAGWAADPFAHGSYSLAKPGRLPAREALAKPVGERIWFAGEATAGGGAMTAGGATMAGERAAREAVAILRKKG